MLTLKELSEAEQREARTLAQIEHDWNEAAQAYRIIRQCHRKEKLLVGILALLIGGVLLVLWCLTQAR